MKLLLKLKDQEFGNFLKFSSSFLIGLKDYSVGYSEFSIKDIKKILEDYPDIELFISINKNIFNKDLKDLEEKLKELSKLKIKAILFYDLSILSLVTRLNLNISLCYHQTHMVVNYNICNFYKNLGCEYAFLSTEIMESEMKEISEKTDIKLLAYFIGHPVISHSKRKLVSNFYNYKKKKNDKKINIIKEKGKEREYLIEENSVGTNIYTGSVLNGTKAFINLKDELSYAVLDETFIEKDVYLKIVSYYKDYLDGKLLDLELEKRIEDLIGSYDGFFYQKTIYKVKK